MSLRDSTQEPTTRENAVSCDRERYPLCAQDADSRAENAIKSYESQEDDCSCRSDQLDKILCEVVRVLAVDNTHEVLHAHQYQSKYWYR